MTIRYINTWGTRRGSRCVFMSNINVASELELIFRYETERAITCIPANLMLSLRLLALIC